MDSDAFRLHVHNSIHAFGPADWSRLAGAENPFVQHEFLSALEDGRAVGENSGWSIAHLALYDTNNKLLGVAPHYLNTILMANIFLIKAGRMLLSGRAGHITQNH